MIRLPGERSLRVIETRVSEGTDGAPVSVLVVEPVKMPRPHSSQQHLPHRPQ